MWWSRVPGSWLPADMEGMLGAGHSLDGKGTQLLMLVIQEAEAGGLLSQASAWTTSRELISLHLGTAEGFLLQSPDLLPAYRTPPTQGTQRLGSY